MRIHPMTAQRFVLPCLLHAIAVLTFTANVYSQPAVEAAGINDTPNRPNVVLIMADDLGYGDLSCYGSPTIRTPVLDRMASEGIRLTSFYAGCTVCTPSRMALLTGSYPARMGWRGGVVGWKIPPRNGLSPQAITMGELFQKAGYRTALVGKWHLGDTAELSPSSQGFETAFFIDKSNNQTKKLWRGEQLVADPFDNRKLTELFTKEAIRFIESDSDQPFFLYLPYSAPHFPAQAHPDWKGKSKNDAYGDVVEELDARIRELLGTLSEQGIAENTIVVFLSDNGVEPGQRKWASAKPYRGMKWSALEGGNRVPCIVRWPQGIPAGQESDAVIAAIDLLPTLTDACGIDLPDPVSDNPKIDGVSVLDTLKGEDQSHARGTLLFWHGWATPQAIRVGQWKLYFDEVKELPESKSGPVLINLADDPAEETNLSEKHPDRVSAMLTEARSQLADIEAATLPLGGPPLNQQEPTPPRWLAK